MPRLVKGGKWVYGWVVINQDGRMGLPKAAQQDYGFKVGDKGFAIAGSRRSGGFGLTKPALLTRTMPLKPIMQFEIDRNGCIQLEPVVLARLGVTPPAQLLAVRGSRLALGFIAKGPIYKEALEHPELEVAVCEE